MNRQPLVGYRHICPVCGKEFWALAEWRYRKKRKKNGYYCSWKCFNRAEEPEDK